LLLLPPLRLVLLLSMLWRGFPFLVLAHLLLGVLLLLRVGRSGDPQKQRQNGCAGDSNYFHKCCLRYC
jgi:hypothetical protein